MVARAWQLRGRAIALDRPVVLGIVNVTPDSFSDGGNFFSVPAAVNHALGLLEEGADMLDIGGESTRPQGATAVSADEELRRILPVVERLTVLAPQAVLSVDTVKSRVAEEVLGAGVDVVNDVSGLRLDPAMAAVCARAGAGVILMHSRGNVSDMATYQHARYGDDVMAEIIAELDESVHRAEMAGVPRGNIALDPGLGFAKRSEHSVTVLAELHRLTERGYPVVIGASRKRFIGELSCVTEPAERVDGTTAANVVALLAGARIFRVHDARPARRALDVAWGINQRMTR